MEISVQIGAYYYTCPQPNAVCGIDNTNNIVSVDNQEIDYTAFNKVSYKEKLIGGNILYEKELYFTYGTANQSVKTEYYDNDIQKTKYFAGNYEQEIINGNTRELHYISGPMGLAAIYVKQGGNDTMHYTHTDHLSSILEMIAGERIVIKDGFHAESGCDFRAYLQNVDCENKKILKNRKVNKDLEINNTIDANNAIIINKYNLASIFPNPSSGIFTIYFTEKPEMLTQIEITDLTGKTIYYNEKEEIANKDYFIINLSEHSKGVYFLKLNYNNTFFTKKIIIH